MLLLLIAAGPARADSLEWSDPGLQIEEGTLRGLPPGPVRWRSGRMPAGGIHLSTLVELRWTAPDGRERQQTLFAEIQDGRPVLSVGRGLVLLRVTYCPAGQACRQATLPFAWDGRLGRFVGADRAARNSLAHTGVAEPDSTPIPDVPARSGNR